MTCREARAYLSEQLNETLGEAGRKLAQHLEGCPACRAERRLLTQARWLLATYGTAACPVDMTHLATRPLPASAPQFFGRRRARLAIASLALTLIAAGWQWQRAVVTPAATRAAAPQIIIRDVAEVQELHESFAVQQSLQGPDGLLLFAPDWGARGR